MIKKEKTTVGDESDADEKRGQCACRISNQKIKRILIKNRGKDIPAKAAAEATTTHHGARTTCMLNNKAPTVHVLAVQVVHSVLRIAVIIKLDKPKRTLCEGVEGGYDND